ncbi:polyhydroxyalkanoate synthesis regulator DNA-binding domain-containing protein [Bdellovibrionota bacterium FG-2]
MTDTKIIKRYTNRKLYDMDESAYVTLNDVGRILKAGRDVKVICNVTKNDITASTLTQLLYEKERTALTQPSIELLKEIIKHGDGSFAGYIHAKMASELAQFDGNPSDQPAMTQ